MKDCSSYGSSSSTENQVRQILWNPQGLGTSYNKLKHDLTLQCILCDFESAMIFWIALKKKSSFSFEAIKIPLQVQGLWLEDICSFRETLSQTW